MNGMRERKVQCLSPTGFHDMVYFEWGDPANPRVLVCVHGLTRCGRDFDALAQAMRGEYRVVCPEVVGRGRSGWLKDKSNYGVAQYAADMTTLLARIDAETVHWVGTSMGGLIGMAMAAQENTPLSRLVLNDVGPILSAASISRIGEYLGAAPRFASLGEIEAFVRWVSAPFGQHTDTQWRHLTEHVVRQAADGMWEFRYDPGIAEPFRRETATGKDIELWFLYDAIRCPTLVLRGAASDLLTHDTLERMHERGPHARVVEIQGVGHAPTLMSAEQIGIVRDFLLG